MPNHDEQTPRDNATPHADDDAHDDPQDTALALIEEQADRSIRRIIHDGRLFFSVIDVIGLLTDSPTPRVYWGVLKTRLKDEGASEVFTKCKQLRMTAADGKQRMTDAADAETLLRIIQSVPSPKAEPIKQWLARVGAQRLDTMTRPIDAPQAHAEAQTVTSPGPNAPLQEWLEYHEQMAAFLRRQLAYETQLADAQAQLVEHDERLTNHDAELAVLQSWVGHLENEQRLLPELLERLGPQTLTSAHQAKVKALAVRLHELSGDAYSKIYGKLNAAFSVGRYSDIPDTQWEQVEAWFRFELDAAERRNRH